MELGDRILDVGSETLTQTNITPQIPKEGILVDPHSASVYLNDNMEWVITPNWGENFNQATASVVRFAQAAKADVWMKFNETLVKVKPADNGEAVYRRWMKLRGQ